MKSVWKKIWPLVIAAVIACSMLIFYGAAFARGNGLDITEENLAENASISGSSGSGGGRAHLRAAAQKADGARHRHALCLRRAAERHNAAFHPL